MGSRCRRGRKPEPGGWALTRQRQVGTIHRPRRHGRAIYPARGGHNTRPLNAHGSLGNYLRQESPFGLSSGDAAEIGSCAQLMIASRRTLKPMNSRALAEGKAAKQGGFHQVYQKAKMIDRSKARSE